MPKISLVPDAEPEVLLYKYFSDKLTTLPKIQYKNLPIPFVLEFQKTTVVYPRVILGFVRPIPSSNLRYIGDDVKVLNQETGLIEKVSIGEPYEAVWRLNIEGKTRESVYNIMQSIRGKLGRTGCIREPRYIEHSHMEKYDYFGTNEAVKNEADELIFIGGLGYRTYMRIAGGISDPNYEPLPPLEQINLGIDTPSN